jgi:dihydrofolate reductase
VGRIVATEFITLDGVAEDPARGGWAFQSDRGKAGDQFKHDELMASEAHLLGRRTYLAYAQAWPSMTGEFADRFNAMPKYVVSKSLDKGQWGDTTILRGQLSGEITRLRERHADDILISGSITLVRSLLAAGLIDELRLMLFPVLAGAGKRLFADGAEPAALRLVSSAPAGDTVILTFHRHDEASS